MNKTLKYTFFVIALLFFLPVMVSAETLGDYVGYKSCIKCHGDIVKGWKTTPHADAFESLKEQGEEKQSIPGCFKCHVVGFDEDGGYVDMQLTPELKDVQCESCHGPARKHVESGGDPEMLTKIADEKSCRVCHTEGQDKNFDFNTKKKWVHASADVLKKKDEKATKNSHGLKLSETRVEFGNMVEGDVVKKIITLTNTGNKNIKINNVTTSCACTTTKLGKNELKPKENTELEITYHTYKFPGKFVKYVTLFTDVDGDKEYRVDIAGYVEPIPMGVLEVESRKFILGDHLKVNVPHRVDVKVSNAGDKVMEVTNMVSKKGNTDFVDAFKNGKIMIKPGDSAVFKASVTAEKKGRLIDYVMIHSNARNVTEKGYKIILIGTFE